MKPPKNDSTDDLRPEYDLTELLKGGVRGKYATQYAAGSNAVLPEPDVVIELQKIGKGQPAVPGA